MKIKVNGIYWSFFNNFVLSSRLDAVASSFTFESGPYDPANADMTKRFKPLTFPKVQFFNDEGNLFATCTIIDHEFTSKADAHQLVKFSGYSVSGVLEDCQIPFSLYPLESNGLSLRQIAERILNYFGIKLTVYDSAAQAADEAIETSVAEPEETVKAYLSKIASQKNILLSHDVFGNVILFRPDIDAASKRVFTKDTDVEMKLVTSGQNMHSILTILRQPEGYSKKAEDASSELSLGSTLQNPWVTTVKRSYVTVLSSGTVTNTDDAAHNALAAELQNIRLEVTFPGWDNSLSFGDIVEIQNDEIFFPDKTRMMIHEIVYTENAEKKSMTLKLVLPEAFTAGKPKRKRKNQFQFLAT